MTRTDRNAAVWVLLAATLAVEACEPASITEARDQLRRGGSRVVQLLLPMAEDSVTVDVGSKLQFNNLAFSAFNFSFNQMLQTTQQVAAVAFPSPPIFPAAAPPDIYPVTLPGPTRFSTSGGSNVASATVGTGYVVRSMTNSTDCAATSVSIDIDDSTGVNLFAFPGVPVPIGGAPVVDSLNAAGKTVSNFVQVDGGASFGACVPTTGSVAVSMTFRPMTLTAVNLRNVNETFSQTFNAFAGEPRITAVDTVFVSTGSFSITVQNRLPVTDTITVRLNGITKAGVVQQQTLAVPAANGTGGTTTSIMTFDLAGARIIPAATIPQVTGTAKATTATITPTNATNATVVTGGGSVVVQSLSGALNPTTTPELSVSLQNSQVLPELSSGSFGNLSSETSVDSATVEMVIVNTSGAPLQLSNFSLRAAQTNASGQPLVDGSGNIIYEKDAAGSPISLTVSDPGTTTFTVGRATTRTVTRSAVALLDRVLHLLLDSKRVALVANGTGVVGDNAQSTITRTDIVKVRFQLTVRVKVTTTAPQ